MIKDMRSEGYEKFCLHLDRLALLAKEYKTLTVKKLAKIFDACNDKEDFDTRNLENAIVKETCGFANSLMTVLKKTKLKAEDIKKCQDNKESIYRFFFKQDYEPIVEEYVK